MKRIAVIGSTKTKRILVSEAISMLIGTDVITPSSDNDVAMKYKLNENTKQWGYLEYLVCFLSLFLNNIAQNEPIDSFISASSSFDELALLELTLEREDNIKVKEEYRKILDSYYKIIRENKIYNYIVLINSPNLESIYNKIVEETGIEYIKIDEQISINSISSILQQINKVQELGIEYVYNKFFYE